MTDIAKKLLEVQRDLKCPKDQFNAFAKYNFRSAEGILEAVKPHLAKNGLVMNLSDDIQMVGDRIYVKAIARLISVETGEQIEVTAYAREVDEKKGQDSAQITGACSSYARKYALNGLFCIDDTKDADATNDHGKSQQEAPVVKQGPTLDQVLKSIADCSELEALTELGKKIKTTDHASNPKVKEAYEARKSELF